METLPKAVKCAQRTWCRPEQALFLLLQSEFIWALLSWFRALFSWCSVSPPTLTLFLPPLPLDSLISNDRDIPFRALCSKVTLYVKHLAVSLWVCFHLLQREASLMMTEEKGSDLCSRMSSGVILLLLLFFFLSSSIFFYPSPWRLVTQAMPHIQTIHWIITPTMHCIVPLLSSIMSHRQDRVVHHRFCSWVGVYISHFVACRILPVPKLLDHGCEVYIGTS